MSLLSVNNLTVAFHTRDGRKLAVNNLSFSVEKGKTLGIVGESGSGKTVACSSLLDLIPTPPGKIENGQAKFDGADLLSINRRQLRSLRGNRIGMIFQDPMTSLNPYLSIGTQLTETLRAHYKISRKQARAKVINALEEVGIVDAARRISNYPHEFSGGMRQRVMIAMALIGEPELLIADEPTTALDVTIQSQILALLKKLQQQRGLSIIFISHDLAVVKSIADYTLVMKDGVCVEKGPSEILFAKPQHPYTRKLITAIPRTTKTTVNSTIENATNLLKIENLNVEFPLEYSFLFSTSKATLKAINQVSLSIKKGEILGLVGESGSGKSTLGRSIIRLIQPVSGEIILDGNNLLRLKNHKFKSFRRKIQMIFQDPFASLNPRKTVYDTLAEPLQLRGIKKRENLRENINILLEEVGLSINDWLKYPHEFSGGQRQRIAIARALALQPELVIADEPVSALDVTIQKQILDLLLNLTQKHRLTMLFISHDLGVVRYLCDRVVVIHNGSVVEEGKTEQVLSFPKESYTKNLIRSIPKFD